MTTLSELIAEVGGITPDQAAFHATAQKKWKLPVVQRMTDQDFIQSSTEYFSSGELGIDIALGGGWARGRIHKIQGRWSAGKSGIIASAVAVETRIHKGRVLLVDYEGTWTKEWLLYKGANIALIDHARPASAEMALDIAEGAVASGVYSLVVLDSVASMSPKAEQDGSHDDYQQGLLARLVGKFVRKLDSRLNQAYMAGEKCPTFFLVNQVRKNLHDKFNPEFTPGGTQQDNHSSTIVDLFRKSNFWRGEVKDLPADQRDYVGWWTVLTVVKNKISAPLKETTVGILHEAYNGHGPHAFYHGQTLLQYGLKLGAIEQAGAWYSVPGTSFKVQGSVGMKEAIMSDDDLRGAIITIVKESLPHISIAFQDVLEPVEFTVEDLMNLRQSDEDAKKEQKARKRAAVKGRKKDA